MDNSSPPSSTSAIGRVPRIGDPAPWADGLVTQSGTPVNLRKLRGNQVLLLFHPHENGSLCPVDGYNFLERHGVTDVLIFGVDLNGAVSQLSFTQQYGPVFESLIDPAHQLALAYGVIPTDSGRTCSANFLIDRTGCIAQIWLDADQDRFWDEVRDITTSAGSAGGAVDQR